MVIVQCDGGGYSNDGEATMDIIKEKGFIDPKPLYYLGFYGLIIILNKALFIPILLLNKFLVPVLAAIFLPKAIFDFLQTKFENEKSINI